MPVTPSAVGRRYSALVVLAVVQLMLVVLAPSKPPKNASSTALAAGPTGSAAASVTGSKPGATATTVAGTAKQATAAAQSATGPEDRSKCAPNGQQTGPVFYMPTCVPAFTGDNGGTTMNGVTADKINFVIYR